MSSAVTMRGHIVLKFVAGFVGLVLLSMIISATSLAEVRADDPWQLDVSEQELKEIADGALTLMSFQVLPDLTTSSLSIQKASSDDPGSGRQRSVANSL
jgi:hypothetical protein